MSFLSPCDVTWWCHLLVLYWTAQMFSKRCVNRCRLFSVQSHWIEVCRRLKDVTQTGTKLASLYMSDCRMPSSAFSEEKACRYRWSDKKLAVARVWGQLVAIVGTGGSIWLNIKGHIPSSSIPSFFLFLPFPLPFPSLYLAISSAPSFPFSPFPSPPLHVACTFNLWIKFRVFACSHQCKDAKGNALTQNVEIEVV